MAAIPGSQRQQPLFRAPAREPRLAFLKKHTGRLVPVAAEGSDTEVAAHAATDNTDYSPPKLKPLEKLFKDPNGKGFSSACNSIEWQFNDVIASTEGLPHPNAVRTASCLLALHKASAHIGFFSKMVKAICSELEAAIYVPGNPEAAPPEVHEIVRRDAAKGTAAGAPDLARDNPFITRATYYQICRRYTERISDGVGPSKKDRLATITNVLTKSSRKQTLRPCFKTWRWLTQVAKHRHTSVVSYFNQKHRKEDENIKRAVLDKWRSHIRFVKDEHRIAQMEGHYEANIHLLQARVQALQDQCQQQMQENISLRARYYTSLNVLRNCATQLKVSGASGPRRGSVESGGSQISIQEISNSFEDAIANMDKVELVMTPFDTDFSVAEIDGKESLVLSYQTFRESEHEQIVLPPDQPALIPSRWMEPTVPELVVWVNTLLRQLGDETEITNLSQDFQNGVIFAKVVSALHPNPAQGSSIVGVLQRATDTARQIPSVRKSPVSTAAVTVTTIPALDTDTEGDKLTTLKVTSRPTTRSQVTLSRHSSTRLHAEPKAMDLASVPLAVREGLDTVLMLASQVLKHPLGWITSEDIWRCDAAKIRQILCWMYMYHSSTDWKEFRIKMISKTSHLPVPEKGTLATD